MKKLMLLLIVTSALLGSCSWKSEKIIGYSCPMECEKDSIHAKPGMCSVCEMDLEPVEKK